MFNYEEVKHAKIIPKKGNFILAGDLGGTHSNFAIFQEKGFKLLASVHFKSQEITNFVEIVKLVIGIFKQDYGIKKISSACFAAACPIHENGLFCSLTNTKWDVDLRKIKKKTKLSSLTLINDFEAIAYGIEVIPKINLSVLKKGIRQYKKPRAIIGAGTGLGKGIMVWNKKANKYLTLKSEGGHSDLPIVDKEEFELLEFLQKTNNNVRWEDVLSGNGIRNLYIFFNQKLKKTKYSDQIKKSGYDPMLITKLRKKDKICKEVFLHFVKFYARCAKNFALDTLAVGGVYIAGGIAANCHNNFKNKIFLKEFLNSKKQSNVLKKIPITVVKNYNISLYGSAVAAVLHKRGII